MVWAPDWVKDILGPQSVVGGVPSTTTPWADDMPYSAISSSKLGRSSPVWAGSVSRIKSLPSWR